MKRRELLALTPALVAAPSLLRAAGEPIKIRDLYAPNGDPSELALKMEGERLTIEGFMAPPLKADWPFFVQTKMPMAVCPFCETEAEWPDDIVAVYTRRSYDVVPFNLRIVTRGQLALGAYRDPATGFLSMVRIERANFDLT